MYAIIRTGGKQYRVNPDDVILVEKLNVPVGETIDIDDVLAIGDGEDFTIGTPVVEGANVKAEVLEQGRHKKVIIFKYKPKKDYRRKKGHRQPYTKLKITGISMEGNDQDTGVSAE